MKLFNSLSQIIENFSPNNKNKVSIYVCGITPYDTTHLGHAFTYIFFDALVRYLKFKGFKVTYTQNVTDINDRDKDILERARQQNISWKRLSEKWTKIFLDNMKVLNWVSPTYYLKASQNLDFMIILIRKLLKNKIAYQAGGSVFLNIFKFKDFGKLSKFSKAKMLKVSKDLEEDLENPDKNNPLDITLWRGTEPNQKSHIPTFKSPYGAGRPGWHIECSAMAIKTLGDQIDIHGGGIDLVFPHHEAEIAQSEGATGKAPFAKYWIHSSQVFYQGQKMSKSKGNLVLISDLLKKYSPNAIRFLLLSNHYRKNWEYKEKDLIKAQEKVNFIEKNLSNKKVSNNFLNALEENFNTPKALDLLEKNPSKEVYALLGFK